MKINIFQIISFFLFLIGFNKVYSQNQLILNQNAYMVMSNSVNLVVDNNNANGIKIISGGNIISENENNIVKWNIANTTGIYIVPFTTSTLVKIPLTLNITSAGVGLTGNVLFSTYETIADDNTPYPSDVTNMNSSCNTNNGYYAVDRFWRIEAAAYATKPIPIIDFGYNDATNEIGGANTIIESRLKAQRFNSISNSWETPINLFGIANSLANSVDGVSVSSSNFFKSWTLIDSSIMSINIDLESVSNATICSGNSTIITPTGAVTYTLLPDNISSTSGFTMSPTATTIYTVSGTNVSGCYSFGLDNLTTTITVNSTPTIALTSGNNSSICSGTSISIVPNGASTYTLLPDNITSNVGFTVSPTINTTYTVLGSSIGGICVSNNLTNATNTVIVNNLPILNPPTINNPMCFGSLGSATVNVLSGVAPITYSWIGLATNSSSISAINGQYIVTISDANLCQITQTIALTQPSIISVSSSTIELPCEDAHVGSISIQVSGGTPQYIVNWSNGIAGSVINNLSAGNYTVNIVDNNNCSASYYYIINDTINCLDFSVPEIFTPNADNKNDKFEISNIAAFPNNKLSIYNRWGNLIYEEKNYKNEWDGHSNLNIGTGSSILPAGTYYVLFDFGTDRRPYTGFVQLEY